MKIRSWVVGKLQAALFSQIPLTCFAFSKKVTNVATACGQRIFERKHLHFTWKKAVLEGRVVY